MDELRDSFGKVIKRGHIAFSLIGFSGSGCTQHLQRARVARNAVGCTLKTGIECPGHHYKRGTPLDEIIGENLSNGACFSRMITEKQFEKFPHNTIALIFNKGDFKAKCTGR